MKPRLTNKVMDGLLEVCKLAEELGKDGIYKGKQKKNVESAIDWTNRMYLHRQSEAVKREERHRIGKEQEALVGAEEEG